MMDKKMAAAIEKEKKRFKDTRDKIYQGICKVAEDTGASSSALASVCCDVIGSLAGEAPDPHEFLMLAVRTLSGYMPLSKLLREEGLEAAIKSRFKEKTDG